MKPTATALDLIDRLLAAIDDVRDELPDASRALVSETFSDLKRIEAIVFEMRKRLAEAIPDVKLRKA